MTPIMEYRARLSERKLYYEKHYEQQHERSYQHHPRKHWKQS